MKVIQGKQFPDGYSFKQATGALLDLIEIAEANNGYLSGGRLISETDSYSMAKQFFTAYSDNRVANNSDVATDKHERTFTFEQGLSLFLADRLATCFSDLRTYQEQEPNGLHIPTRCEIRTLRKLQIMLTNHMNGVATYDWCIGANCSRTTLQLADIPHPDSLGSDIPDQEKSL